MEPVIGAEPTTSPLPRVCSTTELHGPILQPGKEMERETSLELATLCLEGRYSSQLSYSRPNFCVYVPSFRRVDKKLNGGQGRIRTFEDRSQQIYSLSPLATRAPAHLFRTNRYTIAKIWSWQWDSNPQPADYKSAALPIELRQHGLTTMSFCQLLATKRIHNF